MNSRVRLLFLFPIFVCLYLLTSLFIFIFLQGDLQNWYAFMRNDASVALFSLFCTTGVLGTIVVILLKRDIRILDGLPKILRISFLLTTIIGFSVLTYLNFSATEENYAWMQDGLVYQQMGQSFLSQHEFILDGEYTHHFSPLYPVYLSIFFAFFPVHIGTQIAIEIIFTVSIAVVFLASKKLYGTTPAFITTGLIAILPTYIFSTSRNYAEPMMLIWYTLTIFFIIESLQPEKENRIIFAGLCAALGYLSKSSLGYFFLIAGMAGFLWRFYYMGWGVLRNKNYVVAIMVFFTSVLAWAVRNLYHFWDGTISDFFVSWQTSEYFNNATNYSLGEGLSRFFVEFWFFIVLTILFILSYTWIFFDHIKKTFSRIRDERISCLCLAIILPLLICWIMGAIYFVFENHWMPSSWISYDPNFQVRYLIFHLIRYCFVALVPLSWLAYESRRFDIPHANACTL
jgi:hypothetical protein